MDLACYVKAGSDLENVHNNRTLIDSAVGTLSELGAAGVSEHPHGLYIPGAASAGALSMVLKVELQLTGHVRPSDRTRPRELLQSSSGRVWEPSGSF